MTKVLKIWCWILAIFVRPTFYWHIHHKTLMEIAREPIKNRINYIRSEKDKIEIPERLRLLHKVKGRFPFKIRYFGWLWKFNYFTGWEAIGYMKNPPIKGIIEKLHKKECVPDCPWDGDTIFPNS